jgi:hypothetical protein
MRARILILICLAVLLAADLIAQQPDPPEPRSAAAGFLYLEDHRIRYEVLISLRDIGALYPVDIATDGQWTPAFQAAHKSSIVSILESHMSLAINGREATPLHSALVFVDLQSPMERDPARERSYGTETGAVGLIQHFAAPGGRSYEIDAAWDGFNPLIPQMPVRIFSHDSEDARLLSPRQNRLLATHVVSDLAPASASTNTASGQRLNDPDEAARILQHVLENIYGAFAYARDEDIYDALARTVSGELLSRVYLDIRTSLHMEQEGGATARIDNVRVTNLQIIDSDNSSANLRAVWRITGTLEHWGHVHQRTNEYAGHILLRRHEGQFRMASLEIDRHQRIGDEYRVRKSLE